MTGHDDGRPERRPGLVSRLAWPGVVAATTALVMLVPLARSFTFFQRGDTAAQFAPIWFKLGTDLRSGIWPAWLDPDAWAGGNYAAEALFGIYNPLSPLIWLVVSLSPSLVVGVWLVKTATMVALALGVYALSRDYSAPAWAAAALAVALPFCGFTLFWDAGSWAAGLIAFAYTPWVWLAFRRTLRGVLSPGWAFLVGALAVTQGNPYGTLGVVVVGAGLVVEGLLTGRRSGVVRLVLTGLCVAALLPLVYLPLLAGSDLAIRAAGPVFANNGKLRPALGDLLMGGSPTYVPEIRAITGAMAVPATYFAWFVLPLLPWLRWSVLRERARDLSGPATVAGIYLALAVGPAQLWLFRWPLRLTEYTYLGLAVGLAVLLGAGLRRDRPALRGGLTAALLAVSTYLTWAQDPRRLDAVVAGSVLLVVLSAALLGWHRWGRDLPAVLAAICMAGTVGVVALQVRVFGENASSRVWHFPSDVAQIERSRAGLADLAGSEGTVMQFADLKGLQRPGRDRELRDAWTRYLAGSMYAVAGVRSVNNYTGMGFLPFTRTFCMEYDGLTQACGYRNAWRSPEPGQPPLLELMKVDVAVVQPRLAEGVAVPEGWTTTRAGGVVTVSRTSEEPWPDSRLSWVAPGVEVTSAATVDDHRERVSVASTGAGGEAVFGMLGWPGYTATLDGRPLDVGYTRNGLLQVTLPADRSGELEVSYRPPGLLAGLVAACLGALGAGALSLLHRRRARHGRSGGFGS